MSDSRDADRGHTGSDRRGQGPRRDASAGREGGRSPVDRARRGRGGDRRDGRAPRERTDRTPGRRTDSDRRPERADSDRRGQDRVEAPAIDPEIEPTDLDRAARARLRTLSKDNADGVAAHLVMAGRLMDHDPELAYEHAHAALRRAGRVDVVREAVALTAYTTGRYAEALRELRTVRRLSGLDAHRAVEADCERGLGRPERAIALAAAAPTGEMTEVDRVELSIVASGARLDLGEPEAALLALRTDEAGLDEELQHRLAEQKITVLRALGRAEEADALAAAWPEPDDDVVFFDLPAQEEQP